MPSNLGERLNLLVRESRCEQKDIAAFFNIKKTTFNAYVRNKREPSIERLKLFATHFRVSIDYLVGNSDIRNPYLPHLKDELRDFVHQPDNQMYIEIAKEIKEKTIASEKKPVSKAL